MLNGDGQLSFEEFWTILMGCCSALITISAAVAIVISAVKKLKEPENAQNREIKELRDKMNTIEDRLNRHDEFFGNDNKRLSAIEEGNRVTQQAILALMQHAINGNDVDKLKKAEDDLKTYLINKS